PLYPNIPSATTKSIRMNDPSRMRRRGPIIAGHMKERKLIGDILDLNIVSNDVAFHSNRELISHFRVSIKHERICVCENKNVSVHFSFGAQHRSVDIQSWRRLSEVIAD